MKSVLISIKPKWCELIAIGKKTIEVRKTKPRIDAPFKCYIYCTKEKTIGDFILCKSKELSDLFGLNAVIGINKGFAKEDDLQLKGKVIGEFMCNDITRFYPMMDFDKLNINYKHIVDKSCVNMAGLSKYANSKVLYAWCISELKIYDKPKELSGFYTRCRMDCELCKMWGHTRVNADEFDMDCRSDWVNHKPILRPPQSWCYVEEV